MKKDGSPVVSPVWFVMDGEDIVFNTMETSLKGRVIAREPRVSVCVEDETYPYGFATIQGLASASALPLDELLTWSTRIASRYVPAELAEQCGRRNAVEGELLVRVKIQSFMAYTGVAD